MTARVHLGFRGVIPAHVLSYLGLLEDWGLGFLSGPKLRKHVRNYVKSGERYGNHVEPLARTIAVVGGDRSDTRNVHRGLMGIFSRQGFVEEVLSNIGAGSTITVCTKPDK